MTVVATQIPSCINYKENGDTRATYLDDMFFWKGFPSSTIFPDLTGVEIRHEWGYGFKDFYLKFTDAGASINSTIK